MTRWLDVAKDYLLVGAAWLIVLVDLGSRLSRWLRS